MSTEAEAVRVPSPLYYVKESNPSATALLGPFEHVDFARTVAENRTRNLRRAHVLLVEVGACDVRPSEVEWTTP